MAWLVVAYSFALLFLAELPSFGRVITFLGGPVFGLFVASRVGLDRLRPSGSLYFYFGLVATSLLALPFVADFELFWRYWRRIALIFVLMVLVAAALRWSGRIDVVMKGLLITGLIATFYGAITGEFRVALSPDAMERADSVFENPNGFAQVCLLGVLGALYLFQASRRVLTRLLLVGMIGGLSVAIVASGSRGAFLGTIGLLLLWIIFFGWDFARRKPLLAAGVLTGFYLFSLIAFSIVQERTYLGRRLTRAQTWEEVREKEKRITLYEDGWNVFKQYPLVGAGLNQFRTASKQTAVGHADLVELPATTGIIGTSLYYGFLASVWQRSRKILRLASRWRWKEGELAARFGMISVLFVVGLGFVTMTFWDFGPMIVIASSVGMNGYLSDRVWRAVKGRWEQAPAGRVSDRAAIMGGKGTLQ